MEKKEYNKITSNPGNFDSWMYMFVSFSMLLSFNFAILDKPASKNRNKFVGYV